MNSKSSSLSDLKCYVLKDHAIEIGIDINSEY